MMEAGEAEIDLERQIASFAAREASFEIDPEIRRRLLNGLDDIGVTLSDEGAIAAYEAERERSGPVTTALS
jgi:3-isopropylmalate/(R)-2-methylmalate dehydratase small subunit